MTLNRFIFSSSSYDAMQANDVRLIAIAALALKVCRIPFEIDPASHGATLKVCSASKPFNEKDYHSIALAFAEAALLLGGLRIQWNGGLEENRNSAVFEIIDPDKVTNWDENK